MKSWIALLTVLLLQACAAVVPPAPATEAAFDDALFAPLAAPPDPRTLLAVTPTMRRYLDERVLPRTRRAGGARQALLQALADPNALLLPVDYDDAMAPEAFKDAVVYCVDDLGQYESVADILYFFGLPKPDTHLAAVVSGEYPVPTTGRRAFLNMGIAMDDVALSALVLDRALASGAGRYIEFP